MRAVSRLGRYELHQVQADGRLGFINGRLDLRPVDVGLPLHPPLLRFLFIFFFLLFSGLPDSAAPPSPEGLLALFLLLLLRFLFFFELAFAFAFAFAASCATNS